MRRVHAVNFIRTMAVTTVAFLAPLRFMRLGFDGVGIKIGDMISISQFL